MTAPNAELAYKVLDHIDAHPELWEQDLYIGKAECGTTACFAGWAVLLSGATPHFGRYGIADHASWADLNGAAMPIPDLAERLLGASRFVEERSLFDGRNSRDDLGRLVEVIFGPRPASTR